MDVLPHRHLSSHKQIVFLSGLPRTGSTLLTSILSQNPDIYVDGNSALERVLYGVHQTCNVVAREGLVRTYRTDFTEELLAAIPRLFYQKVTQKIIVEKDRGWGRDLFDLMKFVTSQPKILMLVRPINEIVTSFVAFRKRNGDILVEKDL
jgi:sulfotransferase